MVCRFYEHLFCYKFITVQHCRPFKCCKQNFNKLVSARLKQYHPTALMQLCCHLANEYETRNQYASPPRVNAIPAGTLSDFDEILCRWWIPKAVRSLMSKILTSWVQKMWAIFAKNGKNFEFLANISRRGQIPLSDFYKIRHGGGCPRSVASRPTSRLWLLKCGHTGANFRQNAKIGNIWYKFGPNPLKRFL